MKKDLEALPDEDRKLYSHDEAEIQMMETFARQPFSDRAVAFAQFILKIAGNDVGATAAGIGDNGIEATAGGDNIGGASLSPYDQHTADLNELFASTSKLTELYKTTSPDVVLSHVALTYGYTNKDKFAEVPPNKRVPLTYEQLLKLPGFEMRPMLTKLKNRGFNLNELHKANFLSITSSETHKAKFEAITDGGFVDLGQIKERTSCEWNNNYRNELILRVFPEKFKDETPPGDAFHWTSGDSARPMGKHYTHL